MILTLILACGPSLTPTDTGTQDIDTEDTGDTQETADTEDTADTEYTEDTADTADTVDTSDSQIQEDGPILFFEDENQVDGTNQWGNLWPLDNAYLFSTIQNEQVVFGRYDLSFKFSRDVGQWREKSANRSPGMDIRIVSFPFGFALLSNPLEIPFQIALYPPFDNLGSRWR